MKKLFLTIATITLLISCQKSGETFDKNLDQSKLPQELKGLKVYSVSLGGTEWVKVGLLPNYTSTSYTYKSGKTTNSMIVFRGQEIDSSRVVYENDSIVIIRK